MDDEVSTGYDRTTEQNRLHCTSIGTDNTVAVLSVLIVHCKLFWNDTMLNGISSVNFECDILSSGRRTPL